MDPIQKLKEEHQEIECVLDGLEAMASAAEVGAFTDEEKILELIWFFKEFTDGKHHSKEEEYLFPILELLGLPSKGGPTEVMRLEHVQGRKLVGLLNSILENGREGSGTDWTELARVALAYVNLLRSHIEKENHCIFEIADDLLGLTEKEAISAVFGRVDQAWLNRNGNEADAHVAGILDMSKAYQDGLWSKR